MKARRNMTQAESPSIGPGSGSPKIETKINKSVPKNKSVAFLLLVLYGYHLKINCGGAILSY